ncbi:hypothetical protein [Chromobacterium sp. IIBBL 290-4]|uniref:hypothetical protein n=1 Tax=Chromobacterium sp. IIBBL 290-4 TaxID=2953890 RepID=UPI0020B84D9C|nr:hypothetical protein [Chromobacterium sp. IIBBL 290-4]UTH74616.1 hypothetical protein NKT35_00420 [Chromobacterium sp. IIBBL 290-4]
MKTNSSLEYFHRYLESLPAVWGVTPQQAWAQIEEVMQWQAAPSPKDGGGRQQEGE